MKKRNFGLLLGMTLALTSCVEQPAANSSSTTSAASTGSTTSSDSATSSDGTVIDNSGSTDTTTSSGSCSSSGSGSAIRTWQIKLAGEQDWVPGDSYSSDEHGNDAYPPMMRLDIAETLFKSDQRFKVRIKAMAEPGTSNNSNCYGWKQGASISPYFYDKLSLTVQVVELACDNPDPNVTGSCISGLRLTDNVTDSRTISAIDVDSCSEAISMNRPISPYGVALKIKEVKTNALCKMYEGRQSEPSMMYWDGTQYKTMYEKECATNNELKLARPQSCWELELQVSTDDTQDFD